MNPPQQFLNTPGGASRIERLKWRAPRLTVNGAKPLTFAGPPGRVTAVPLEAGIDLRALRDGELLRDLADPQGHASALLQWEVKLQPGETQVLSWIAPLDAEAGSVARGIDERMEEVAGRWGARLARMELTLPAASQVSDTLRTSLAAILSGQLADLAGKKVALVLTGGNIDLTILSRLIESALVADGRLVRFTAVISDRPGGLATTGAGNWAGGLFHRPGVPVLSADGGNGPALCLPAGWASMS